MMNGVHDVVGDGKEKPVRSLSHFQLLWRSFQLNSTSLRLLLCESVIQWVVKV